MGKLLKGKLPCPCGKSSDAWHIYENGGYCFSCNKSERVNDVLDTDTFSFQVLKYRSIDPDTFRKYNVSFKINDRTGEPVQVAFPYFVEGSTEPALKLRDIREKRFMSKGPMKDADLFGADIFPPASSECVVVTEGEFDALSAWQMLRKPAVSVRSASSAFADCKSKLEYLNSFPRVYLAFDNDEAGRRATREVAALFDNNKVYNFKFSGKFKDSNDFLQNGEQEAYKNAWFYSRRFVPDVVVSSYKDVEGLLNKEMATPIITYPFPIIQDMTYGIRTKEVVLVTAQEGQGKTEIIRAMEFHTLQTTDLNIGIIHLEEGSKRTIMGLAGYDLQRPVHLPDSNVAPRDVFTAYQRACRRDERVHIINHFDDDDPKAVLDLLRFLVVKCGCRIVFLDHITMLVSGVETDDERRKLDYISTKLALMVEELDFALIMISHVNDEGKTRGSRNISKVCSTRLDLERDHLNPDPVERNTTHVTVSKNRFGSKTGPAGALYFDPATFVVREARVSDTPAGAGPVPQ